jgi:hypothetical protein
MKNFRILIGLALFMGFSMLAQASPVSDVSIMLDYGKECVSNAASIGDQYGLAMAAPLVIFSKNITPEMISDLKIKFGSIKMITIVIEEPVYDIDDIPFADLVKFKELGVDYSLITNKNDTIENRIAALQFLIELKDGDKSKLAAELYSKYQGKEIEKGEIYQFLVKRPDRGLMKMLGELGRTEKYEEFNDKAIKNLIVGGDMDALDDGLVYMGIVQQLRPMMKHARSFLSKA